MKFNIRFILLLLAFAATGVVYGDNFILVTAPGKHSLLLKKGDSFEFKGKSGSSWKRCRIDSIGTGYLISPEGVIKVDTLQKIRVPAGAYALVRSCGMLAIGGFVFAGIAGANSLFSGGKEWVDTGLLKMDLAFVVIGFGIQPLAFKRFNLQNKWKIETVVLPKGL